MFKGGRRASSPQFLVVGLRSPQGSQAPTRLGLTVSRKVGRAVRRNRLRRRMREVFRTHRPAMQGGWDIVVVARPGAAELDFATVRGTLLALWNRLGILEPSPPAPPCARSTTPRAAS